MKFFRSAGGSPARIWNLILSFGAILLINFFLVGCVTTQPVGDPPGPAGTNVPSTANSLLRVGNKIRIEFSGLPLNERGEPQILPLEQQIKDDGTITLPYLTNSVVAADKTIRQLEKEIHNLYVPDFFRQITVTVIPLDIFYSVGGQVNKGGQLPYTGDITVVKAIHAAGDFTDFAKRWKVQLTRAGAKHTIEIDYDKAVQNPALDLPVYPGDTIFVPRRRF